MSRPEYDLAVSVRKAISPEETAPKRLFFTDNNSNINRSSNAFWQSLKVQPLPSDEVQTFKALICIHKLLQEGHPICLNDAQNQLPWIDSLGRSCVGDGLRGYGLLIREYSAFLLSKLKFHRRHQEFNGTFEYEEYVTLKATLDPNEGYETVSNLMTLQDQIDAFQKLIFSHFRQSLTNECKISALVPLVQESYGIYRFITSMLRAMFKANELIEVLEPLEKRYNAQFHRLINFYYECSNLKYLARLITLPKLPECPVDLRKTQESVYLGLKPVEKSDQISNHENLTGQFSENPAEGHKPEDLQTFWEVTDSVEPSIETQFEALPDMYFLRTESSINLHEPDGGTAHNGFSSVQETHVPNIDVLQSYQNRIGELESSLNQLQNAFVGSTSSVTASLDQANGRAEMWATKYENLAQLYTRLRKEHLVTIDRTKALDTKVRELSAVAQRCKSVEKALQDKSIQLLASERERNSALAKLQQLQETSIPSSYQLASEENVRKSWDTQLREKDEEIAIMKEAFDQSLLEINHSTEIASNLREQLIKTIASIMKSCATHIALANEQLTVPTKATEDSSRNITQMIEQCDVLLLHLPEILSEGSPDLIVENCLEIAYSARCVLVYFNTLASDVAAEKKVQVGKIISHFSASLERLFTELSASFLPEYRVSLVISELLVELHENLTSLCVLVEGSLVEREQISTDATNIEEVFRSTLERVVNAKDLAGTLQRQLGTAQYSAIEISLSSKIVALAMEITNHVTRLLDKAARTDEKLLGTSEKSTMAVGNRNRAPEHWSNGFLLASKAVAGAISVLISVADGVLRGENDIEQLNVANQNVISATTQLIVAARVKLPVLSALRADVEDAATSVIQACRALSANVREIMETINSYKAPIKMSSYELKVAELDQQVKIVQLETALESARIKLGELRKLSYTGVAPPSPLSYFSS